MDKTSKNISSATSLTHFSEFPSTSASSSSNSTLSNGTKSPQQHFQFFEWTQPYFNRAKFFFNPPHIRQQAQMDRRFLQRINREASYATVNSFFVTDCPESQLEKWFQELYKKLLRGENNAARAYQLILNSLIFYYSKQTWSTSVPKYVFECLEEFLLKDFHRNLEQKSVTIFELELVCLLELFMLRYSNVEYGAGNSQQNATEDNVYNILAQIRQCAGSYHLSTFVQNTLINHFGYSMSPTMRTLCDRLDLKVRLYKLDPFAGGALSSGKRKFSFTSFKGEESTPRSSEPTHSSSEEMGVGRKVGMEEEKEESSENGNEEDDCYEKEEREHKKAKTAKVSTKQPPPKKAKIIVGKQNGGDTSQQRMQRKGGGLTSDKDQKLLISSARTINRISRGKNSAGEVQKQSLESAKKKVGSKVQLSKGNSTKIQSPPSSSTRAASILLSDELLTKYRQRMNAVKRQRTCGGEIFYGRSSMRRGLFERSSHSPDDEIVKSNGNSSKSYTPKNNQNNKQKNRSGRRVISSTTAAASADDDRVHIAHTLLNVHNKNPLEAFKLTLPKSGSRRLLKQAGKSARKKMERLRRAAAETTKSTKIMEGNEKGKVEMAVEDNSIKVQKEDVIGDLKELTLAGVKKEEAEKCCG